MAADLPVIKLVQSKGQDAIGDCAICAIGTICGKTYEDVVETAALLNINWRKGMFLTEIIKIAKEYNVPLSKRRKYDLETDMGILAVTAWDAPLGKYQEHVIVLHAGKFIDSDLSIWAPDAYIKHYKATLGTLLRID